MLLKRLNIKYSTNIKGDGVVGIEKIAKELVKIGFDGYTTLEIAGPDNVKKSVERLNQWC